MVVAVLVALLMLISTLAKRPTDDDELGSVRHHRIAEHRVDSR
jgi:hypothetical protein